MVLALVLAPAFSANAEARSFALTDYYVARGDFYASELIPVAPLTGRRVPGQAVRLGDYVETHVLSPDRRVVAFGGESFGEVVRVDLVRMRRLPLLKVGRGAVKLLAWPSPDRMIVMTGDPEGKYATSKTLRVVDPVAGKVLASRPLGFVLATSTSAAGRVVLVASPAKYA